MMSIEETEQEWCDRANKLGSIPIDLKINSETGRMYFQCYKYKSGEFDTNMKQELDNFRKLLYGECEGEA